MDKATRPETEALSANAADDEAARSSALLFVDEAGVTRPATETPSSYAARMFGEEAAGNYGVMGRLMIINRLPIGDLGLLTVGFRITDRPGEKWTRRFKPVQVRRPCRRQGGHPHLLRPPSRTSSPREPARRRRLPRSLQGRISCNTTRPRRHWLPRLRGPAAGSGFRITLPRTGIPVSPASPPRPSGTPPWTGSTWLPHRRRARPW